MYTRVLIWAFCVCAASEWVSEWVSVYVCIVWACTASCSNFLTTMCKLVVSGRTLPSERSHNFITLYSIIQANILGSSILTCMDKTHISCTCTCGHAVGRNVGRSCLNGNVLCLWLVLSCGLPCFTYQGTTVCVENSSITRDRYLCDFP